MTDHPTLAQVVAALERRYDPRTAESWDAVGLVCGDPDRPVRRVLFAVDPVGSVVDEAEARDADLVVTHHPLFLTPVNGVAATTPKGKVVHRLISGGRALFVAHTNADVADPGVSDALAAALRLTDLRPIAPSPGAALDKLVTYVPRDALDAVFEALSEAGAGRLGDYDHASFRSDGTGTFRPLDGANPAIGSVGELEQVDETCLQMVLPRGRREQVVVALLAAHPYEEPAYELLETVSRPGSAGLGRIGVLAEPTTLEAFTARVAEALPVGAGGVRAAGEPNRTIRTVAVCGGAGDSLLAAVAAADVDVYVTGDLRHHRASEHLDGGGPALIDATHFGTEWPWLRQAADLLASDLAAAGATVDVHVSETVTDPWSVHRPASDTAIEGSRH